MHIIRPASLKEALEALSFEGAKALSGGTNVMVDLKKGREKGELFVSLDALGELKEISYGDDGLHIGSRVTFSQLEEFLQGEAAPAYRALLEAVSSVGGPQIRNRGTIGGNILCASPSSDSVPALMVLGASLKLVKLSGGQMYERLAPLDGFILGVRKTALEPGELMTEILVPKKTGISCFYKAGTRKAMAISVVNQALYMEMGVHGTIEKAAVASGSVAPTVVRAPKTEAMLEGKTSSEVLNPAFMSSLREVFAGEIAPITDLRGSADYRYLTAENMLEENLRRLLGE